MPAIPADEHYALCETLDRVVMHVLAYNEIDREVVRALMDAIHNIPGYIRSGNADFGIQVQHDIDNFDVGFAKSKNALNLREIYNKALARFDEPR